MNFLINFFLFLIITPLSLTANNVECQGAKIRVINKITAEKVFYSIPLSQTLELDNAKVKIYRCLKIEKDAADDDIALLSHVMNYEFEKGNFLGWIFKSSQYLNTPVNPTFDIKLEECLIEDPIFLKKTI